MNTIKYLEINDMKANELRIGNLAVDIDTQRTVIVDTLQAIGEYEHLKGLLLTAEWHRKFGATEANPYHYIYKINVAALECHYNKVIEMWWFVYENSSLYGISNDLIQTPLPREIKYVHEFQNFYREFTGKKLIIK